MPKARRKARAARGDGVDFAKKRARLGSKATPSNATSTDVRARQIYLPGAAPSAADAAVDVPQLLARTMHYNTNARVSALSGLTRAIVADGQTHPERGAVLRAGLRALQDGEAAVRTAGIKLLSAATAQGAARFAPLIGVSVLACLSHVSADVQAAGARAVTVLGGDAFPDHARVLGALADALARARVNRRAPLLEALTRILQSAATPSRKATSNASAVPPEPGVYHRIVWAQGSLVGKISVNAAALVAAAVKVATVVSDVVQECFPATEAVKDKTTSRVFDEAARCLYAAVCVFSNSLNSEKPESIPKLDILLAQWTRQRNKHHVNGARDAHTHLAACAIRCQYPEAAARYVAAALAHGNSSGASSSNTNVTLERVAELLLDQDVEDRITERVVTAWAQRWHSAVADGDANYLASSAQLVAAVVAGGGDEANKALLSIPRAILAACTTPKESRDAAADEFVANALRMLASACRGKEDTNELRAEILQQLVCDQVIRSVSDKDADELVAVLYYSGQVATHAVAKLLVRIASTDVQGARFASRILTLVESLWCQLAEDHKAILEVYAATLALRDITNPRRCKILAECKQAAHRIVAKFD